MKQRNFRHSLAVAVAAVSCVFAANGYFGREAARADQPAVIFMNVAAHTAPASTATVAYATVRPAMANASWEALTNAHWR